MRHREGFVALVEAEIRALPEWVRARLGNLAFLVEDRPPPGEDLLGLYEEDAFGGPARVTLYREPILAEAGGPEDLPRVVRQTLAHEIGHHFGMTEEEMDAFERAWEAGRGG